MAIVQDIRFTWAEMMQNEPARFHVLEHWLKVTHDYVGLYFRLRDSKTTAVAQCHLTLLNGSEQRRHVAASEKTGKKYVETLQECMKTWSKTSAGYPIVFALTDAITIEKIAGVFHRAIITVHVSSWLHEVLSRARQLAVRCHGIKDLYRTESHVSVDWVFVDECNVQALGCLLR